MPEEAMANDEGAFVPFRLRDGTPVCIRSVRPEDSKLIAEGFDHLSPQSRYFRFLSGMQTIPDVLMQRLTHIDHHDHEAIGVLDTSGDHDVPAAVARYIRDEDDPEKAEIAITVADEYQRRGLGLLLISLLVVLAQHEGISVFRATVQRENHKMLSLLMRFQSRRLPVQQGDVVQLELPLHRQAADYADKQVQQALRQAQEIECHLHQNKEG